MMTSQQAEMSRNVMHAWNSRQILHESFPKVQMTWQIAIKFGENDP